MDDVCFQDIDDKKLQELAGRLAEGSVEKAVATQRQLVCDRNVLTLLIVMDGSASLLVVCEDSTCLHSGIH